MRKLLLKAVDFFKSHHKSFLILLSMVLITTHTGEDYMNRQFSICLILCCIPISFYILKEMGLAFGCLFSYLLISSVNTVMNFYGRAAHLPIQLQNNLSINAAFSLIIALLMFFAVLFLDKDTRSRLPVCFALWGLIDCAYKFNSVRTGFILNGGFGFTGLLDYCGMDGTAIALSSAMMIPAKGEKIKWWNILGLVIAAAGVVLSKTAIPFGVFGLVLFSWLLIQRGWFFALAGMGLSILSGWFVVGDKIFNSSRRFEAYQVFIKFLIDEGKAWLGYGLGGVRTFAPTAQERVKFMVEITPNGLTGWLWDKLHSEFIQSFFEFGLPGFVMIIVVYALCVRVSYLRKDPRLFAFGVALGGACALNYPLRYAITALMTCYFVVECLKLEKCKTKRRK